MNSPVVIVGACAHAWSQQPTTGTWTCARCLEMRPHDQPPPQTYTDFARTFLDGFAQACWVPAHVIDAPWPPMTASDC